MPDPPPILPTPEPSHALATVDRTNLQEWYRGALRSRVAELEVCRPGLAGGDPEATARARAVGHALRGSGGSFGFPEVSDAGLLLEEASPEALTRRFEATVHLLRTLAWPDNPEPHAWLFACAGLPPGGAATLQEAWRDVAQALGVEPGSVAERVAGALGLLATREAAPSPGALRLVPHLMLMERYLVPLGEDGVTIRVATSNPLDLEAEADIQRVSGRTPVWVVVSPDALRAAVEGLRGRVDSTGSAERPPPHGTPDPARAPILVVDDDAGSRLVARAVLERKGYPVIEAADGLQALDRMAEAGPIALAVVDLEMPGMGGRELVGALRAAPGGDRLAVIVLTGTADPTVEADLMEAGADDYLRKPLDPRLFLARVSATLRRSGWSPA